MANKILNFIYYSRLTLPRVIKKVAGKTVNFLELIPTDQRAVLEYIVNHQIDIKVFGHKWYDVLSNKFFAIEYRLDEAALFGVAKDKKEFDTFGDFFRYVRGEIYQNSCFYGYVFSEKEIKEFSINLQLINFNSFIQETIDLYTFESLNGASQAEIKSSACRAKAIARWFQKASPISTLADLEASYAQFTKKFDFWEAGQIFFSILLRKEKDAVKAAAMEFACKHDGHSGLDFDKIFLTYGRDAASYVIDHFDAGLSPRMIQKRKGNFRDELAGYDSGNDVFQRNLGFSKSLQLYYVKDGYYSFRYRQITSIDFFTSFKEYVSYTKGDLSNADLSMAPISRKEVEKYKTNEKTKLPISQQCHSYEITKEFANHRFFVRQKWLDFDGNLILAKEHSFVHFFDFVHFLKGDLSDADLLLCDGLENISKVPGLKLDRIKVRSVAANKLGLPIEFLPSDSFKTKDFPQTDKFELSTIDNFLAVRPENDDYSGVVNYISDIHLFHRFAAYGCKTVNDIDYVMRTIAKTLADQAVAVNLIGGDVSDNFSVFQKFVNYLSDDLSITHKGSDFFFTLGNHELWDNCFDEKNFPSIVEQYRTFFEQKGNGRMHLVQNNIFYADGEWQEITEEELSKISPEDLRTKLKSAFVIIFGGMGFAGKNNEFNANNGVYGRVTNRQEEIHESEKFFALYQKVTSALHGMNLIVLTHMPMKDWGGDDMHAQEGVIYVNGHTHRNYYYDDGRKRIFADNQIGYHGKQLSFKKFNMDFGYEWFADYKDGIYEITRNDYENFYSGIGVWLNFKRKFAKLFMIKREKTYMFLMKTPKGTLVILNGGAIRKAGNHSLEYFYDNLTKYSDSIKLFLTKYSQFQKHISDDVKRFGGDGTIHGCIVDIDFYNHLYVNIRDGKVTPYYALSMVDKTVYENLPSLLNEHCPQLFYNYKKLIEQQSEENALTVFNEREPIVKDRYWDDSTEIYRESRIINGLQYTTRYNIVRLWNDIFVEGASEENGKMIVLGILDPDTNSQPRVSRILCKRFPVRYGNFTYLPS